MKAIIAVFIILVVFSCKNQSPEIKTQAIPQYGIMSLLDERFTPVEPNLGYLLIKARRDSLMRQMNRQSALAGSTMRFDTSHVELYTYFPFKMFRDSIQRLIDLSPTDEFTDSSNFGIRFYPIIYDSTTNLFDHYLLNNKNYRGKHSMLAAVTLDSVIISTNQHKVQTIYNLGGLVPPGKPPLNEKNNNLLHK